MEYLMLILKHKKVLNKQKEIIKYLFRINIRTLDVHYAKL